MTTTQKLRRYELEKEQACEMIRKLISERDDLNREIYELKKELARKSGDQRIAARRIAQTLLKEVLAKAQRERR